LKGEGERKERKRREKEKEKEKGNEKNDKTGICMHIGESFQAASQVRWRKKRGWARSWRKEGTKKFKKTKRKRRI
jgi:hypothetical protein